VSLICIPDEVKVIQNTCEIKHKLASSKICNISRENADFGRLQRYLYMSTQLSEHILSLDKVTKPEAGIQRGQVTERERKKRNTDRKCKQQALGGVALRMQVLF